ncbi:MAG: hypothetical protein JWQ48_1167 [Conexibacter sp.]|nr:hypothetical protein [Conexibacter sp.]
MSLVLAGLYPSALLPLREDLSIAERDYVVQIQHLARAGAGVGGVIVNDPAGDAAGLSREERARVLELAAAAAPEGFPVIAGIQAESVERVVELLDDARAHHADAALVFPPTDPRLTAELTSAVDAPRRLFAELAAATDLPLVVAQTAAEGGASYPTQALVELARLERVVAIVDAIGDAGRHAEQYRAVDRAVPLLVAVDGPELRELLLAGAEGAALGISNIAPRAWGAFVADLLAGRRDRSDRWYAEVGEPLLRALGGSRARASGSGAAWVKHGLVLLGQHANSRVRPPQPELSEEDGAAVREALAVAGLLPGH